MLEALEPVAAPLDLLHEQVQALGGTVARAGGVVGQDLGTPRGQGAPERSDLLHVVGGAGGDGLVEEQRGLGRIVGEIEVSNGFLSVNRPSWPPTEAIHQQP